MEFPKKKQMSAFIFVSFLILTLTSCSSSKPKNYYNKAVKTALKQKRYQVPTNNSPTRGAKNAPIEIVEYSDYACYYSKKVQSSMKELEEKYKGKVKFVYKHFVGKKRPAGVYAANAAVAAFQQGKFWKFHDELYNSGGSYDYDSIFEIAKDTNLNMQKFRNTYSSRKIKDIVRSDNASGSSIGVKATPTIFINGIKLVGAQSTQYYEAIIDALLKEKLKRKTASNQ